MFDVVKRSLVWGAICVIVTVSMACGDDDFQGGGESGVDAGMDSSMTDSGTADRDASSVVPLGEPITIMGVRNEAAGDLPSGPVTFALPFGVGRIPAGSHLGLRLVGGSADILPTQVDLKATHPDGSFRHAILTVELPSMTKDQYEQIEVLRTDGATTGEEVTLSGLLDSGFDADVTVQLDGVDWHADAVDALQNGLQEQWLSGPLVSEWIAMAPLKDVDGREHPHLAAWFHVRAYRGFDRVRVDTVLENTWTYVPEPQNYQYVVTLQTCGRITLDHESVTHYRQGRWRQTDWCGQPIEMGVVHDATYIKDTFAVPNYDTSLHVGDDVIQGLFDAWQEHSGLMDVGLAEPYMPSTGGRADIGPAPRWNLVYLLTGDPRARAAALGTASRSGAWPIHYRNHQTLRPLTIEEYPYITILGHHGDSRNPETGLYEDLPDCAADCQTPLHPDSAHQPALVFLPYLLTGDYYYLEELRFWGHWKMIQANPYYREFEKGLVKWEQVRGQAWTLRTLAEAAFIVPDEDGDRALFEDKVHNNLSWYNEEYVSNPDANALYFLSSSLPYEDGRGLAPWQDDFFTWAVGRAWELGFADALPVLRWKAGFSVLRLTDPGFCWIFASKYTLLVRDSRDSPFYDSMADVYEQSVDAEFRQYECGGADMAAALGLEPGEMTGYSHSTEGFPSNLQIAAALAADSGAPGALEAWSVFDSRSVKPDYSREPNFAIYPRSQP